MESNKAQKSKEKATETLIGLFSSLSREAEKEPISPERVAALAQAISALVPLVMTGW